MMISTARFLIYGVFNMGFLVHGFPIAFLRPGGTVELYSSAPVELHTVFFHVKNLAKNTGQKSGQESAQIWSESCQTSGQNLAQNPGMPTMY